MPTHAKKSLGQNFLVNPHILDKIVATAEVSKEDIIVEIGPGTGNLTKKLAEKAKQVIAVEKDRELAENLRKNFKDKLNLEVIEADILKWTPQIGDYKIAANIPYYLTSNLIRKIFEEWPKSKLIVLTIQKEVAERIVAKPPHMNLLALSVQYYSEPKIVGVISKNNFRPIPKIDSAIIRLNPKSQIANSEQTEEMFKIIKVGFSEKRKQLASVLAKRFKLSKDKISNIFKKSGLDDKVRAENLSLEDWKRLSEEDILKR